MFPAPESSGTGDPADTVVFEAKPIQSITLNSVSGNNFTGLNTDHVFTGFDDGTMSGTSGNDLINGSYLEPIANGTD